MNIRNATAADLTRIMEIYAYAREYMAAHGNPNQWGGTNWPPEELIRDDIEDGEWLSDEPYGVIHRIASDGSVKGVGTFCFSWAYEQCPHLRADTHPDNTIMQNLLTRLGFEKRGIIHVVEDDYPRYAYEIADEDIDDFDEDIHSPCLRFQK